jgi:hypothetical protein
LGGRKERKGLVVEKEGILYTKWKLEGDHCAGVLELGNGRLSTGFRPDLFSEGWKWHMNRHCMSPCVEKTLNIRLA